MGATLASLPSAVWAHLLLGESSSSNGGGLEHLSDAFHSFQQCQSNPPAVSHHSWEAHDIDYSFGLHDMLEPPPPPNSLLPPPVPNLYGQAQWNGPGEYLECSSLFNQQEHEQQQQHCLDYQEPSITDILPNSRVNLLHESPKEGREAKRSAAAAAAAPNQGNGPPEEISSSRPDLYKRPRLDQTAACVPFKGPVRKEKLGERVTALQQLVSPFGKTDTASVLQEAIGYIKFLQDQVQVLSTPYMRPTVNSGSINHHNFQDLGRLPNWPSTNAKRTDDVTRQDLRSRGLCLVPVSCTRLVANDNGADFWTPAISGGCR